MATVDQALAATLKTLREQKGISQSEVSTSLGVSQPTVANWENGKRSPTVSNLYAVSTAYETPAYKILEMADHINKGKEVLSVRNKNKKEK